MSATEIIEQIKGLPEAERAKVLAFFKAQECRPPSEPPAHYADDASFQAAKEWAFKEHDELLRKLAK